MSVLIVGAMQGDVAAFEKALTERAAEFDAFAAKAREMGCRSHRFGIGDGFVEIVDEWDSAAAFERFFTAPELQAFVAETGMDTSQQPQIRVSEATELQAF